MGGTTPKAFLPLRDRPLFLYSFETLVSLPSVTSIVVVVGANQIDATRQLVASRNDWSVDVVAGGAERQDSVAAGLAAVGEGSSFVLVHDAARPFVSAACMMACIDAAALHGAAVVALPANDTLKRVDADQVIRTTLDRSEIWLAQTPQVFRAAWLRQAFEQAVADGVVATDDATLVERCGFPVHVVPGEPTNRKLTTQDDLDWAEWLLSRRD